MKTFYFHIVFLCLLFFSNILSTQENLISDPTIVYVNICEQGDENQYRSSEQIDETTNTETTEILIYPNPTNEILSVEFYGMKEINCVFEICDISGRIVLYHILNDIIMNIDVSKLAKGSYIYRINDKSGNLLKTDKLIIM